MSMALYRHDSRSPDLPAICGGEPVRSTRRPLIFGAPVIGDRDVGAVAACLRSGWIGAGLRVKQFEEAFAAYKGARYAVAVSSGTAAIHLSLVAMGIGPGDEVIAPVMTFPSAVHAILHAGASPVLVDCDRATFNIEPDQIEPKITPRTKAIMIVHMCGRPANMRKIMSVARRHRLRVIEDCAHAIESSSGSTPTGLIGDAGCFSFYATKNITTGDGGMVVARNRALIRRIKRLSLHGMTADAWSRAHNGVTGYRVVDAGFKYNMTDIEAALGLAQLDKIDVRWVRRRRLWDAYNEALRGLPLVLPPPELHGRHAFHLYTPLLKLEGLTIGRDEVIDALRAENIGAGIHYVPVHLQPYYRRRFGFKRSDFPAAAFVGDRTISLPLSSNMTVQDVADVALALSRILSHFAAGKAGSIRMRGRRENSR